MMRVGIAADPGGFELTTRLMMELTRSGFDAGQWAEAHGRIPPEKNLS
jgi:hypothetical protein